MSVRKMDRHARRQRRQVATLRRNIHELVEEGRQIHYRRTFRSGLWDFVRVSAIAVAGWIVLLVAAEIFAATGWIPGR